MSGRAAQLSIVAVVSLAVVLCLLAASFAAAQVDRAVYRQRVAEAVRDGVFAKPAITPFAPHARSYRYHYNDCLIASMLVLEPKEGRFRSAVSPLTPVQVPARYPDASVPQAAFCGNLELALSEPGMPRQDYHNYLHGDWVLAALLLGALPFEVATGLLFLALVGLAAAAFALPARALVAGRGDPRRNAAFAAMGLGFLLFGGLGLYGWSFSFAPSDIVLAAFLLYAWKHPLDGGSTPRLVLVSALFGALTAAFEFLVGAAPAGLVLLLAAFAFGDMFEQGAVRSAKTPLLAFSGAFLLAFAWKMALVAALWGWPELASAGSQLLLRTSIEGIGLTHRTAGALSDLGIAPSWATSSRAGAVAVGAVRMIYYSDMFEWGSRALGVLAVAVAPAALAILAGLRALRSKSREARIRARFLVVAALGVFGWYMLFANHTIGHAPFMMRPLSWLTIVLCGYVAWLVTERRGATLAPRQAGETRETGGETERATLPTGHD